MILKNNKIRMIHLFLISLFLIFPLIFHNSYLDITKTKTITMIVIAVFFLVALPVEGWCFQSDKLDWREKCLDRLRVNGLDLFVLCFLLCNIIGCSLSGNVRNCFFGVNGKMFGLDVILICVVLYFLSSRYAFPNVWKTVFITMILIVSILGILNRFGVDPFQVYSRISNPGDFLSTIGQINIFSQFLCIFLPFVVGFWILEKNKLALCSMFFLLAAGICSNSDGFFLGFVPVMVFYLLVSIKKSDYLSRFCLMISVLGISWLILEILSYQYLDTNWRELQNQVLSVEYSRHFLLITGSVLLSVLFHFLTYELDQKTYVILTGNFILILCVCFLFVVSTKLTFDDSFATNRGYIWRITLEKWKELSPLKKLFGVGTGNFLSLTISDYQNQIKLFGYYFQDAHNEFLQYLATNGIVGVICYFGMILYGIEKMLKIMVQGRKMNHTFIILICFFLTWLCVGLVNNPLIYVTPYLFVFLGMARQEIASFVK